MLSLCCMSLEFNIEQTVVIAGFYNVGHAPDSVPLRPSLPAFCTPFLDLTFDVLKGFDVF